MIYLTLPYPISANRYWATRVIPARKGKPASSSKPATKDMPAQAITYVTADAEAYRSNVQRIARAAGLAQPLTCRVELWLRLYPARPQDWARRQRRDPVTWDDDVRCIDLGNAEKVLSDALQGIVFDDDRRIWRQHKERMEPDARGARVELAIRAMPARVVPQADLLERAA